MLHVWRELLFPRPIILGIKMFVWFWCIFPHNPLWFMDHPQPKTTTHLSWISWMLRLVVTSLPLKAIFFVFPHTNFLAAHWNCWPVSVFWVFFRKVVMMKQLEVAVVLNIFYFHPYLGRWSNLTNIFQRGWNHQLGGGSCWICLFSFLGRLVW